MNRRSFFKTIVGFVAGISVFSLLPLKQRPKPSGIAAKFLINMGKSYYGGIDWLLEQTRDGVYLYGTATIKNVPYGFSSFYFPSILKKPDVLFSHMDAIAKRFKMQKANYG